MCPAEEKNTEFLLSELSEDLKSNDTTIRKTALSCLIRLGSGFQVENIIKRFSELDPSPEVRYIAKKALDRLNIQSRPEFAQTKQLIARLLQNTGEKKIEVYKRALASEDSFLKLELLMLIYADPETKKDRRIIFDILKNRLSQEKDPFILPIYVKGLGIYGDDSAISILQNYLSSQNPRVVANAIEALEELNSELSLNMVLPLLKHEDNRVRGNAVKLVFRFDALKAVQVLKEMSESPLMPMRDSTVFCLRILDFAERESILVNMWERESDDGLRLKIAAIMKKIGSLESLLAFYRHPPSPVLREKCQPAIDELHNRLQINPEKIKEILNDETAAKIKAEEEKRKAEELQREQKKKDTEKELKKAEQRKIALLKLNRQKLILLTGGIFGGLFFLRLTYDTQVVQKKHTIDAITRQRTIEEAERQLLSRAEFLKSRGKFPEAVQLFNIFLKTYPQHRRAEQSRAFCLVMSGHIDEGYKKYSELSEVVRNSPVILHNLAVIDHFYHNNSEKAAGFLKTALNLRPDYLPAQKLLAELYDLKGLNKEAEELRKQATKNSNMEIGKLPPFRSLIEALQ